MDDSLTKGELLLLDIFLSDEFVEIGAEATKALCKNIESDRRQRVMDVFACAALLNESPCRSIVMYEAGANMLKDDAERLAKIIPSLYPDWNDRFGKCLKTQLLKQLSDSSGPE